MLVQRVKKAKDSKYFWKFFFAIYFKSINVECNIKDSWHINISNNW